MPAYSFQETFVPYVLDGTKTNTVRKRRKHLTKQGDTLYLYFGLRTKYVKKLREETCTQAISLVIQNDRIVIYDRLLTNDELEQAKTNPTLKAFGSGAIRKGEAADRFAWQDGFRPTGTTLDNPTGAFALMLKYWSKTHELPWAGDIIYWH